MTVVGLLKDWWSDRQTLAKEKFQTKLQIQKNKTQLAMSENEYNHDWEMANLADNDKYLRYISFALFSMPFLVALFAPHAVQNYFTHSLSSVPMWWQKTYMGMMGGIWGIASLKNMLPSIAQGMRKKRRPRS